MQITIDTEKDDLLKAAAMLQYLAGEPADVLRVEGICTGSIRPEFVEGQERDPAERIYIHRPKDSYVGTGTVADLDDETIEIDRGEYDRLMGAFEEDIASLFDAPINGGGGGDATVIDQSLNLVAGGGGASLFNAPKSEPATNVQQGNVELDSAGMPWDERIHAGTQTKTADGKWKKKRGVDAALVAQVEAEAKPAATPPPAPPAPDALPAGAPPPPPPPATNPNMTFQELLAKVMGSNGAITPAALGEACKAEGVESFPALHQHPDKVPPVAKRLGLL